MTKFSEFYSHQKFYSLVKTYENFHSDHGEYIEFSNQNKLFCDALLKFLEEKVNCRQLPGLACGDTHEASFLSAWANLISGKMKQYDEDLLKRAFSKICMFLISSSERTKQGQEVDPARYDQFVSVIDSGDFDIHALDPDCRCEHCDKKIFAVSKGWQMSLQELCMESRAFKPLKPCIERKIEEVEVEFKTGELLISDWIRIPEFTDSVKYNSDHSDVSINASLGRLKSTQYAAKHGFVTVHVGNTCPYIFQDGNDFVFGHPEYDEDFAPEDLGDDEDFEGSLPGHENKGMVCTDLWNVTIIDKTRLVEIVAEKLGPVEAENVVEKYIEENNPTTVHVVPGNYRIMFNPTTGSFEYETEGDRPTKTNTFLTMKKTVQAMKRKP